MKELNPVISLHNGDCLEAMKLMEDGQFDLAIVDPPYGINVNHSIGRRKGQKKSGYKKVQWDSAAPSQPYFDELLRVSRNQIIWGANHFIDKIPIPSSAWVMWDKMFSEDVSFAQFELAWTSFDGVCKKFIKSPNDKSRIHPTQKPVALYKWLLKNYAKPGDTILDTHLGSMSIAIACHDMGFDLTGYELDKEYYEAGMERVEAHRKQGQLFDPKVLHKVEQESLFDV